MGLFDGGIPLGMQQMIMNMLKNAAPELAKQVDGVAVTVASFKAQLDRIEARQHIIMKHFEIEENHATGSGDESEPARIGGNPQRNSGTLNGAGKQTGD